MHQIIIDGNAFYEIDEDCVRRKQEKAAAAQQRIENREQEKKNMGQQTDLVKNGKKQFLKNKKRRGAAPADSCHQQPHPLPQPLPQPRKLLPFPQKSRSRIIQQQLSLPKPYPLPQPLPFPQQASRRMIQIQLLHPQPLLQPLLSHPHPQFVAAKSLILFPPRDHLQCIICLSVKKVQKEILCYTINSNVWYKSRVP